MEKKEKLKSNFEISAKDVATARKKFSDKDIDKKMKSIFKKVAEDKQDNVRSEVYHHIAIEMKKTPEPRFERIWLENAVNAVSRRIREKFKRVEVPALGFILGGSNRRWDDGNWSGTVITVAKLYDEKKGKFSNDFEIHSIGVNNVMADPELEEYIFEDIMSCDPILYSFKITKFKGRDGDKFYWNGDTEIVPFYASLQDEKSIKDALKEHNNITNLKDLFMWNEEKENYDFIITLDKIEKLFEKGKIGFGNFYASKVWVRDVSTRVGRMFANRLNVSDDELSAAYDDKTLNYEYCAGNTSDTVHDFDVRDILGVDSTVFIIYYVGKKKYTNKTGTFECPQITILKVVEDEEANEDIEPTTLSDYPEQPLFDADESGSNVDLTALNKQQSSKGELDNMFKTKEMSEPEHEQVFGRSAVVADDGDEEDKDGENFTVDDLG